MSDNNPQYSEQDLAEMRESAFYGEIEFGVDVDGVVTPAGTDLDSALAEASLTGGTVVWRYLI